MDEKRVRKAIAFFGRKIYELGELEEQTDGVLVHNIEYYLTAIEALEKQMAKKPRENGMQDGLIRKIKYYTCPTCGNCLLTEMMNERQNTSYCWDCGQRLDWSEKDEQRNPF